MKKTALIPSYEPEEVLLSLVRELTASGFEVLVVDDGSGSAYKDIFRQVQAGATVISYPVNHGKGYALKTGLQYIADHLPEEEEVCVVTLDSDGQHAPADALALCREVEGYPDSFVVGSRVLPKDAPVKSRLGNGITRLVYRTVTGCSVYDTQSGLRAFSARQIPLLLSIPGDRYEYEMNVLLYLARHRLPVREIPIRVIYFDKTNSVSHFNAVRDSARIYKEILKFTASSLSSFLVDYGMYSLILALLSENGLLSGLFRAGGGLSSEAILMTANFGARAVSSVFNYTVNRKLVFESSGSLRRETVRYFELVLFNICVNSLILTGLTSLGWNAYGAKILVELIMFLFSYLIQHFFIFRKE